MYKKRYLKIFLNLLTKDFFCFLFCAIIFQPLIFKNNFVYANSEKTISTNYLEQNNNLNNEYILGEGDVISIIFDREIIDLNTEVKIDPSGNIKLPRFKTAYVEGLTVEELRNLLNTKYSSIIKNPNIEISILKYRPIQIFVYGEVNSPGLYIVKEDLRSIPTVFDALKYSKGITAQADLSNIEIIRNNSISNGGGKIKTNLNFIDLINKGDTSQNIRLFSGDTIKVLKSDTPATDQIRKAIKFNLNPDTIKVYITGRVENPGVFNIEKLTKLNDAIKIAGGTKSVKGKINFIRYKGDGEYIKRTFKYSPNQLKDSPYNPTLQSGDIINVEKGLFASSSEVINEITSPFTGILNVYSILNLIND